MATPGFSPIAALAGIFFLGLLPTPRALAAETDADWARVTALDAGPQGQQRSAALVIAHLGAQEKALRTYLAENPGGTHDFEARLRLARLLQIRGDLEGSTRTVEEGRQMLAQISKGPLSDTQRVEVDFAGVTLLMRTMRAPTAESRARLLAAARKFQQEHPADRRVGALLAEVATLFTLEPKTMRKLLEDAAQLSTDEDLRGQIGDDLKRLDLMGRPVPFHATTADGLVLDAEQWRGSVVALLFFARWSGPSLDAMDALQQVARANPGFGLKIVGVSLDGKAESLAGLLKEKGLAWPVAFDGLGWKGPLVRSLGINALPSAWLLDKKGRLRSLNALENTAGQVRAILREP